MSSNYQNFNKTTTFAGFDSIHPPAPDRADVAAGARWRNELYIHSNLDFAGAYLSGPIPDGAARRDFTGSSSSPHRASWVGLPEPGGHPGVLRDLTLQGWGLVFFYVGFSVEGREPAPRNLTEENGRRLGRLHGRHVKKLIYERGPDFAGCTVMVDNEDSEDVRLTPAILIYYDTIFQEMQTSGPAPWGAVRPGLYAHSTQVIQLLPRNPGLIVWTVQLGTRVTKVNEAEPFEQIDSGRIPRRIPHHARVTGLELPEPPWHISNVAPDAINIPPTQNITLPIRSMTMKAIGMGRRNERTCIALGGQLIWYQDDHDRHPSVPQYMPSQVLNKIRTARCTEDTLQRASNWDFDFALVRNPCYPAGSPRIQFFLPSKICGFYSKETMSMRIYQKIEDRVNELTPPTSDLVVAEAPLISISAAELLTLGQSGLFITSTVSGTPPAWAQFQAVPTPSSTVPSLRRLRAFSALARDANDVHMFYITEQHSIISRRRLSGAWSDAVIITGEPIHPLSNIATSHRGGGASSVDIFYINAAGALHTAWWTFDQSQRGPWPSTSHQRLPLRDRSPPLYPGSAMTSVSPADTDTLVFTIGLDLHLYMHSFVDTRWAAGLTSLGDDTFLHIHTQISALVVSPTNVRVAAFNDKGDVCVFEVTKSGGGWAPSTQVIVLEHRAIPPTPRTGRDAVALANGPDAEAVSFDINPYGDIVLAMYNGELTVFVAGMRGGETALLRKAVVGSGQWLRERGFPGVG